MRYKFFTQKEFDCKCGCGATVEKELGHKLDFARFVASVPFVITSGMRCLEHNRAIVSSDTSTHVKGLACDIKFTNSREKFRIVKGLMQAGFTRIGINEDKMFIHADLDKEKPKDVLFKY